MKKFFSSGIFSLASYASQVRRRSVFAILAMLVGFAVMAFLSYAILDKNVTVSSSIMLVNNLATDGSVAAEAQKAELTEEIAKDSVAIVSSLDVVDRAMTEAKIYMDTASFAKGVRVTRIDDSNALKITITYSDGVKAANMANQLATIGSDEIQRRFTSPPVSATVLDRAAAPSTTASLVKAVTKGFAGAILGMLFYLGFLFYFQIKDNFIRDFKKFCASRGTALLGILPAGEKGLDRRPGEPVPESVRILRTAVRHAAGNDGKCLLICSTGPKEGRSTIASGLALAFSETEERVLLIDADMRSAHIRSRLRVDSVNGLSDVLTARVSIDKAVARVNEHLDVICSTSSFVENPSALLDSTAMYALLDALRSKYDRILVDAPNANSFADACSVSAACDGCILVGRYEKTRVDAADDAILKLQNSGGKLIGLIANAVPQIYRKKQTLEQ